ncbi:MAG: tRNA (adenosine(37)-N6)-threonylcarbamoyltransferase complex ATPase subunit type 1 TsaE [Bacteroidales bacterium]|nr:tRNA (adenosine(37)-N6)-threonylcarbamoyltransferase complex ATPase subunit type 1 TsaE [Bacteroidales bacterium]
MGDIVPHILKSFLKHRIFVFKGEMGAGKTTFIKYFCEFLGVVDLVTSPTFSIVNEYRSRNQEPLYHFDFYRIESIHEAFDLGYEEYFYSGFFCFVEWPEKIEELLPENSVYILIDWNKKDDTRIIRF